MSRRLLVSDVEQRFKARGYVLLEKESKLASEKHRYRCRCGNEDCYLRLNNLAKDVYGCKSCSMKRRRETSLKIYGTEHPAQSKATKEKMAQTNLLRRGVRAPGQELGLPISNAMESCAFCKFQRLGKKPARP
jgi:late competence protein required for DNA uptake (superfamily II DNA/RNA helicase)